MTSSYRQSIQKILFFSHFGVYFGILFIIWQPDGITWPNAMHIDWILSQEYIFSTKLLNSKGFVDRFLLSFYHFFLFHRTSRTFIFVLPWKLTNKLDYFQFCGNISHMLLAIQTLKYRLYKTWLVLKRVVINFTFMHCSVILFIQ